MYTRGAKVVIPLWKKKSKTCTTHLFLSKKIKSYDKSTIRIYDTGNIKKWGF